MGFTRVMQSSSVAQSIAMVPWYWSGWQELSVGLQQTPAGLYHTTIGGQKVALLTTALAQTIDPQLLAAGYETIYVDYWPDELPREVWKALLPVSSNFVWLPPRVQAPARLGQPHQKSVLITDSPTLPPAPASRISRSDEGLSYTPIPVPVEYFDQALDPVQIGNVGDIIEALNAPSWVVSVSQPQVEQAIWMLARQYGIRYAWWERCYSSPLRALGGFEAAFEVSPDTTLRGRVGRVMKPEVIAKEADPELTLAQVKNSYGYAQLRLDRPQMYGHRDIGQWKADQILPRSIALRQLEGLPQASWVVAARQIAHRAPTRALKQLESRLWQVLVIDALAAGEYAGASYWAYLYNSNSRQVQQVTLELLQEVGKSDSTILRECLRNILQAIFTYDLRGRQIEQILAYAQQSKTEWLPRMSGNREWAIQYWLAGIKQGALPHQLAELYGDTTYGYTDGYAAYGVGLARAGRLADGYAMIKQDAQTHQISDEMWRVALEVYFVAGAEEFEQLFCMAADKIGVFAAASAACGAHLEDAADPELLQRQRPGYQVMHDQLRKTPEQGNGEVYLRFAIQFLAGDTAGAHQYYTQRVAQTGQPNQMLVALCYYKIKDKTKALEWLSQIDMTAGAPSFRLAVLAGLYYALGMPQPAVALLQQLYRQEPGCWRPHSLEPAQQYVYMAAGMIGRAINDPQLVQLALERLNDNMWRDKTVMIAQTQQACTPDALPQQLRTWIVEGLKH